MTTATKTSSNSLVYKTSKVVGKKHIFVSIRLNDECKNGHQDFSITGDIYEAGKPKIDRYHLTGGCIHEEIEKYFPEFKRFIALHLCDYLGIPMHAGANGHYHLTNGFNSIKDVNSPEFKAYFCECYRVTPAQFDTLKTSKNEVQYCLNLEQLGIFEQWKRQADYAIKALEELTNTDFIVDSKRTQYHRPTDEQITEEIERQKNGYYTPAAEAEREKQRQQAEIDKLNAEFDARINKTELERSVLLYVLKFGSKFLDNCLFYSHSNEIAFNWRGYNNLQDSELLPVIQSINATFAGKVKAYINTK